MLPSVLLTRRSVAAAVVGAGALLTAGCDTGETLDLPGLPRVGEDPDRDLVVTVLQDEQAMLDQVERVRRRHRALRSLLRPAATVHADHVELLTGAVDDVEPGRRRRQQEPVPADPASALAGLVRAERALGERHVAAVVDSRSGALARVVASMSAAAAQQAVTLAALPVAQRTAP